METIIQETIDRLETYGTPGCFRRPNHAGRARAVARSLAAALADRDLARCRGILTGQFRLFSETVDADLRDFLGHFLLPEEEEAAMAPPGRRHRRGDYFRIVRDAAERIRALPDTPFGEPGIAIVHRVWLGKPLSIERIRNLQATHRHLSRIWRHPETGKRVPLTTILWSNSPSMIARAIPDLEVRDIESVLDNPQDHARVMRFAQLKEFSFAADVLRYLILFRYGGLHLGIRWMAAGIEPKKTDSRFFSPTKETVRAFTLEPQTIGRLVFPFSFSSKGIMHPSPVRYRMQHYVDSDVLYVGSARSPFSGQVLTYQRHILKGMQRPYQINVVRNNRIAKGRILERMKKNAPGLEAYCRTQLLNDVNANVGAVVAPYPLHRAMEDHHLMTRQKDWLGFRYSIPKAHTFMTKTDPGVLGFGCRMEALGLVRNVSQSWLNVPLTYRPFAEW